MAASEESCDGNPNFAIICSFITKFGDECGVNISIPYLQQMLEDTKNVNEDFQELLIHLLRRGRKRVNKERWEKCLIKFCHEYSSVDAWEIERFGFTKAKLSVKLEILKRLLELQFDANAKFKAEVNKLDANSLRLLPLGRDIDGQAYWYQLDKEYNLRLYRETIGEEGAWELLCSNTGDLKTLLASLEKKYSGSTDDACEDKSNDSNNPKSPSSMLPVPKIELDTEDLTSHLSESKPCTIIIKTEKRDTVSHSELPNCVKNDNCAIETEKKTIGCELENSTKGSVKLKLKLEPSVHSRTEQKSSDRTVVKCSTVIEKSAVVVLDAEPMEVEISKATNSDVDSLSKSAFVNDVEMGEESASTDKVKPKCMREEQSDQKFSINNSPTVVVEHSDSINHHKSSKIRLYEKWSNEKKLDTAQSSAEECSVDLKISSVIEQKDQHYSVTSNQKSDPSIPLKCSSEQSSDSELINKQSDLDEQSMNADIETAVDLSKSSRVNVIVQNMCSKPVLSNGVSTTIKSNSEKLEKDSVRNFSSSNIETDKHSDSSSVSVDRSHESSVEIKYKSTEVESNKANKLNQGYSDCYDTSVITKASSSPGFSHLQALQNMCESNAMGGIPSVIQSTNRHSTETNRNVISECKTVMTSDVGYENMSRRTYNFNDVHCSNNKTHCDSETTNIVLKSNVHKSDDERNSQAKNESSFNVCANEQESSQESPTDLSCSATAKPDNCDLKSSQNIDKTSTSLLNKKDAMPLKESSRLDVEKEKAMSSEKICDLSKKCNICVDKSPIKECDSLREKDTNLCNLSRERTIMEISKVDKVILDGKNHSKELCHKRNNSDSSESAIKSIKTSSCASDVSSELPDSEKVKKDISKDASQVGKEDFRPETIKELDKKFASSGTLLETVSNSSTLCASSNKSKDELVSVKEPTNSPNFALKEPELLTALEETLESKCTEFENEMPSLLKEADSSLKPFLEISEGSEKVENVFLAVKSMSSDVENKELADTKSSDVANKEKELILDKLLSKSNEISSSEVNKATESELNINQRSESIGIDKNITCSNEIVDNKKSKETKFVKEDELDLSVDRVQITDVFDKNSHDNSSKVADKGETLELVPNNDKITKNRKGVDKVSAKEEEDEKVSKDKTNIKKKAECKRDVEKGKDGGKVSENKLGIEKLSEDEMDVEKGKESGKVSENKMDIEKVSEGEMDVVKLSEKRKSIENVSESKMDVQNVSENRKNVKKLSESTKDVKKVYECETDLEKVSTSEKSVKKMPENEKDVEKVFENKVDRDKMSKKERDKEKASKNEKDVEISKKENVIKNEFKKKTDGEKISKKKQDMEKISEKEQHEEKISEKEQQEEKISEKEQHVEKKSDKDQHVEKKSDKDQHVEKISEKDQHVEKVSEKDQHVEKVSEKELQHGEKMSEKELQHVEKMSEKELQHVEKMSEKELQHVEKMSEKELQHVEKMSDKEKNVEKIFRKEKDMKKMSKREKDVEKVSREVKDAKKVSENKKDIEKVSNKDKDVDKVSKNEKNIEKVAENEKGIEKVSKNEKGIENVYKNEKDVEKGIKKVLKNEKDVEKGIKKVFINEKDVEKGIEKVYKNEKDVEKGIEKVSKNEKGVEKVSKNEIGVEKLSKNKKDVEKDDDKISKNKKDIEKLSTNKTDAEKVSKNEKDVKKVPKHEKDVENVYKNEKDIKEIPKKGKDIEKLSEKKCSITDEKNKSKVLLDDSEANEEVEKLEHQTSSSKNKCFDNKVEEISKFCTSLSENPKKKSVEMKKDNEESCLLNNDSVLKTKCESSNENNEKSLKSKTKFSEDDKPCSPKVNSEERLEIDEDKKSSDAVSGQNAYEPENTDNSTKYLSKNLGDKTDERSKSSAEKDVEMFDISAPSESTGKLSDFIKPEDTCMKSVVHNDALNDIKDENVPKPKKSKGRPGRKASISRRKNRKTKGSLFQVPDIKTDCETVSSIKEDSTVLISKEESSISNTNKEKTISSLQDVDEHSKTVLSTKVSYEERLKVYNLRHSTCLEAKFKHPFCDKYVKEASELKNLHILSECTIELTNDEHLLSNFNEVPLASTKTRLRGKNSKQSINNKPQPIAIPVSKPAPPAKKTPASNVKKRLNRNRKKEDSEKDDFAIPEGFLEILGNAEKAASEKGASGKKRKGFEPKDTSASQQYSENESAPIKRSRRIQEQHQKKMTELAVEMEREQRILEQLAKRSNNAKKNAKSNSQKLAPKLTAKGSNARNAKGSSTPTKSPKVRAKIQALAAEEETCMESRRTTRKMNSRSKNLTKMTLLYEDESKDSQFSTSRETEKSKRRKRGRGQKKGFRPWDVSSESESSIEELTEEEEEEPDEPLIFDVNEDEFACEEVDPNAEPVIVRRARTAKKTTIEESAEECINDDTPCKRCGKYDKPEWILLCDKCDSGYHTHCLIPPLMLVPDGDWFCQPCEHMSLCQCLHEELSRLEVILKQREREELRKQRLAYVGISLDNVLKPEKKEKSDESEKEVEEKEEIEHKPQKVKPPVEDERHQKLYGKRSVRARRTVNYQFKEYDELIASALQEEMLEVPEDEFKEDDDGSEAGSDKPFTAKISKRKKRGRRWKDLDFSDEDEDSEDDYQGGSTDSEATMPPSSHSDQESGSGEWKITKSRKKHQRKPSKGRRRRRGDSSEEDWEDEIAGSEAYRPTTRRAAQKAISYRELSSEDEDEWGAKPHAARKRMKASSSESESSFKRKPSKKKRIHKWASSDSSGSEEEKSLSSSEGESEEEGSQDDDSENEWKIDRKEKIMRLKSNTNKKVLSSDEDEESSTQDSVPKKQPKKMISDESEEEDEEESESEENSEESEEESEEEEDIEERKSEKKATLSENKVQPVPISKSIHANNSNNNKPDGEKKGFSSEKTESTEKKCSTNKQEDLPITENKEFQPKVLVKKELCSVNIPLEPIKQTVAITPVVEKAPPKTIRKETTKMVPCVIPYDKSPKSGHASNPEEESDKEISKEEEVPHRVPSHHPAHFPKQSASFASPSSRIQFGGVLARHSVPPPSSSVRHSVPPSSIPPRILSLTNLSTRPSTASSVVVRHTTSPSNLSARPNIPSSNIPVPPNTSSTAAAPTQTVQTKSENKPYKSTIMEPFSNMDDENDSDDEVPLERIPTACVPAPLRNRPVSFEREAEYRPAAKELSSYSYAPPEEKPFPGSYSSLAPFQDYSTRPSPLKPSLVETYPNNSSPSKLTPLDTYSQTSSPKGFISLDSYSENRKKKHCYGNTSAEVEPPHRPAPSSSENYQGGEIRFPPEPSYPCPQSPNTYPNRSPSPTQRDPGTPPRLYSQFPDAYAPPRSPEYYQNHQYYASEERIPRPSYQPNYAPQEPSFVSNPYVATPVPQPNGGFMIDTLLRARNNENEEDELTVVTDIVSYITQE